MGLYESPTAMETSSGEWADPFKRKMSSIRIEDIAYVLAGEWRFGGHCRPRFSVGQHCLNMVKLLRSWTHGQLLQGLMHDSAEYVMRDFPSPYKKTSAMSQYRQTEQWVLKEIFDRFGILYPLCEHVHRADEIMAWVEGAILMPSKAVLWVGYEERGKGYLDDYYDQFYNDVRYPYPPEIVEELFLKEFYKLAPEKVVIEQKFLNHASRFESRIRKQ